MAYITQSDLDVYSSDDVLKQLTDDDNSGAIDTGVVTECITAAEGEVDSFLAKRYDVPISGTVPEIVKEWSVQLATLRLHQRRPPVPSNILAMAETAREQLLLVARGTMSLDIGTDAPDETSTLEPEFNSNTRQFNRTNMTDAGW